MCKCRQIKCIICDNKGGGCIAVTLVKLLLTLAVGVVYWYFVHGKNRSSDDIPAYNITVGINNTSDGWYDHHNYLDDTSNLLNTNPRNMSGSSELVLTGHHDMNDTVRDDTDHL